MMTSSAVARELPEFKENRGIAIAFDAPEGSDAPPASVASPQQDSAPAAPAKPLEKATTSGFVFDLSGGVRVLGGNVMNGVGLQGTFAEVRATIGGYTNAHLGFVGGIELGYGGINTACDCSTAAHIGFPVSVQYAFVDHNHGPYLDGGLTFLSTYVGSVDSQTSTTFTMSSAVDANMGLGYRVSHVDVHAGASFGKFDAVEVSNAAGDVKADIANDAKALHYAFTLTAGWHFAP